MNLDLARIAARELAAEFVKPLQSLNPESAFPQLTLRQILLVGALITRAIATYWETPGNLMEELDFVCRTLEKKNATQANLEEFFYQQIGSGQVKPEQLRSAVDYVSRFVVSPVLQRRILTKFAGKIAPPGPPGRSSNIRPAEYPVLASRSEQLFGSMKRFLEVAKLFPSKSGEELIAFMVNDYVGDAAVLVQYVSTIKAVFCLKEFSELKHVNTRARYLADAAAGSAYGLAPVSAHENAEQGRRIIKKHKGKN